LHFIYVGKAVDIFQPLFKLIEGGGMTTMYIFKVGYTKAGLAANPSSDPIITISDGTNILVSNAATTHGAIDGEFRYFYSGIDDLNLMGLFHTDDATFDKQDQFIKPDFIDPNISNINTIVSEIQNTTYGLSALNNTIIAGFTTEESSGGDASSSSGNNYFIGNLVTVSIVFRDKTGAVVDPAVVTLEIKDPNMITTTYTYGVDAGLIKDSVGNYHFDIDVEVAGAWTYFWQGTGVGQSSSAGNFVAVDPFVNTAIQPPLF
jgi:hypothetical protein